MKKILLSLLFIGSLFLGRSQVVFNEISPNPDEAAPNDEYLELFNTGSSVNLLCYTLLAYDNVNHSAWIYRLPAYVLAPGDIVVLTSSIDGSINYKGSAPYTGLNQISWNVAGSLKKYTRVGSALTFSQNGPSNDILLDPSGGGGIALFLFDATGTPVNGFVGSSGPVLPPDFATLQPLILPAEGGCSATTLTFSAISANSTEFQSVTAATGKDNGYYRTTNGLCGTWEKSSNDKERSPGQSNGGTAAGTFATVTAAGTGCDNQTGMVTWTGISIKINSSIYNPSSYVIYEDKNNNLLIDPATDNLLYSGSISDLTTHNFANVVISGKNALLIRVSAAQNCLIFFRSFVRECINLPVNFNTFNANRTTTSSVAITWTTSSEQNNKGFNVQKNVSGEWKTIAFVPSQALGGNSSSNLSYSFKDVNSEKGITQYRIQQVDLDGKAKYSDIRAVRGENTASKIVVYPNPSVDGKLNVVFEDNSSLRDVYVSDMQGKIIRSYRNISNNILVIEKLTSGFYTIKVTNRNTAASSVEKVIVK